MWRYNAKSVSRHDPKYLLKTFSNFLDSSSCLVRELKRRNLIDRAKFIATNIIFDAYLTLNKKEWLE
jgi:hypothetical protein